MKTAIWIVLAVILIVMAIGLLPIVSPGGTVASPELSLAVAPVMVGGDGDLALVALLQDNGAVALGFFAGVIILAGLGVTFLLRRRVLDGNRLFVNDRQLQDSLRLVNRFYGDQSKTIIPAV